jgi:hypothetical protein
MENINDPMNMNNFPLDVLKRKEWVRKNKEKAEVNNKSRNRVDMIGSGNIYDVSKIETMIARENYFNQKFNKTGNNQDLQKSKQEEKLSRQPTESRHSQMDNQSNQSYPSRNSYQSGYRDSMEQGWPAQNNMEMTQERRNHPQRQSMNAKEHNDQLFKKKAPQRKSLGYSNISSGKYLWIL